MIENSWPYALFKAHSWLHFLLLAPFYNIQWPFPGTYLMFSLFITVSFYRTISFLEHWYPWRWGDYNRFCILVANLFMFLRSTSIFWSSLLSWCLYIFSRIFFFQTVSWHQSSCTTKFSIWSFNMPQTNAAHRICRFYFLALIPNYTSLFVFPL